MQRLAVLCLIAVLVACTSAPGPSSEPRSDRPTADATGSPLPSGQAGNVLDGQIAYVGGADPQIHLLDLASGESLQLTQLRPEHAELTGVGPMRPALSCFFGPSGLRWSPDGERLAFSYGSCDAVIYAVDLEGNLTRIGDGRGAAWSHDGRFLVYGANVPYCAGPCGQPAEPGTLDLQIVDLHADGVHGLVLTYLAVLLLSGPELGHGVGGQRGRALVALTPHAAGGQRHRGGRQSGDP